MAAELVTALRKLADRIEAHDRERQESADVLRVILQHVDGQNPAPKTATYPHAETSTKGGRPSGYKMSEATKAKLRAAAKRRHRQRKAAQSAG